MKKRILSELPIKTQTRYSYGILVEHLLQLLNETHTILQPSFFKRITTKMSIDDIRKRLKDISIELESIQTILKNIEERVILTKKLSDLKIGLDLMQIKIRVWLEMAASFDKAELFADKELIKINEEFISRLKELNIT